MMADDLRRVTLTVTVAIETAGDASLEAIARAFEQTPSLPFAAGATNPMGTSICTVTRRSVSHASEQEVHEPVRCPSCGHADANHKSDICQIPDCACLGARAA